MQGCLHSRNEKEGVFIWNIKSGQSLVIYNCSNRGGDSKGRQHPLGVGRLNTNIMPNYNNIYTVNNSRNEPY